VLQSNNRLPKSSHLSLFGTISMLVILLSGLVVVLPPLSANASHRVLHIPNNLFTPPNQLQSVPKGQSIPQGLNLPKNLIVGPSCTQMCPPLIGTQKDDIIIATAVTDSTIYGLGGNDVLQCGPGACKAFAGPGDNILMASLLDTATGKLYGGSGNNIFIGGAGANLMVGGKGNDQFYAGSGHDVMIGGGGANFFDCGLNGNGVILDFNPANGDTKASNCKFVVTVHSTNTNNPGSTLSP
jgi:RTX calcium-binding nonapeptide repeat (4 copies)